MGLFSKLFKGPEPDMEKSTANAKKVRALFDKAVEYGEEYGIAIKSQEGVGTTVAYTLPILRGGEEELEKCHDS